jgi:predicted HTH transcriptional regulator
VRGNYISAIRNKQIATLFKEAGIIEKYGSGIKRIIEAIRLYRMPDYAALNYSRFTNYASRMSPAGGG